jgi:uncharacterized protein
VIRRLKVAWPAALRGGKEPDVVRLLAVSDERVPGLSDPRNWEGIKPIDAVLGCGDLEPDYLDFLGNTFRAPLLYVRGNHDRGGAWAAGRERLPQPLSGRTEEVCGLVIGGLSWPSGLRGRAERDEQAAWRQALGMAFRSALHGAPQVMLSHVPPQGLGDIPVDPYHAGFAAYRWLCRRFRPVLWLHGHTTVAAAEHWRSELGPTTLVNVTGAALIQLESAPR